MSTFPYTLSPLSRLNIGLIVLQPDATIEPEFHSLIPPEINLYTTRIESGAEVTPETLSQMETHLPKAASLLPISLPFGAIGYACTSGTAQIGTGSVASLIQGATGASTVTEPITALTAACSALGINRLAFLSPYVESVSNRIRETLSTKDIETPTFGTFNEAEEARVHRISTGSVFDAAKKLAETKEADALFLSCTNLHTLSVIEPLEDVTGLPTLSSNLVLAWHLTRLTAPELHLRGPGRLVRTSAT